MMDGSDTTARASMSREHKRNVGVKDLLSGKGLNNGGDTVQGKSSKCIKMKHVDRSNILEDLLKN